MRGVKYLWEGGVMDNTKREEREENKWKQHRISRNKHRGRGGEGEGERRRKQFRKAEQSKDILNKHQDAVEKMVRKR